MDLSGSGINEENHIVNGSWIAWLIDDSIGAILYIPFCPYHFVPYHFVLEPCCHCIKIKNPRLVNKQTQKTQGQISSLQLAVASLKPQFFPEKIMFYPPKFLMTFFSHQLWLSMFLTFPPIFAKATKPLARKPKERQHWSWPRVFDVTHC